MEAKYVYIFVCLHVSTLTRDLPSFLMFLFLLLSVHRPQDLGLPLVLWSFNHKSLLIRDLCLPKNYIFPKKLFWRSLNLWINYQRVSREMFLCSCENIKNFYTEPIIHHFDVGGFPQNRNKYVQKNMCVFLICSMRSENKYLHHSSGCTIL